jgi:general secretion pathway protein K
MAQRPQGAVLVSTLVLVGIAAALAAAVMWRGATAIAQVENSRDHAQAQWMARAAVSYARWVLETDAQAESLMDHLAEPWAQQIPLTSVKDLFRTNLSREDAVLLGQGKFSGGLADAQGRLNLAHLVADGQRRQYGFQAVKILFDMAGAASHFEAFVEAMEQASAQERQHGVSPSVRARQAQLMRALASSEMPPRARDWLMERLVWLPQPTPVNVNTASAEVISAALLQADPASVSALIEARERYPMRTLAEISALVSSPEGLSLSRVDVKSQYFRATGLAQFGRAQWPFEAWMLRRGLRTEVLAFGERGVL